MFKYLEERKRSLVYLPLIIYWSILLTLTSIPSNDLPQIGISDKIEHTFSFLILTVLLYFTIIFQKKNKFLGKKPVFYTLVIISFYAAFDELHQLFIPGRSCEFLDWAADVSGALIGVSFVIFLAKKYKFLVKTG